MLRRALFPAIIITLGLATAAVATPAIMKWPPWISIESPVNPYDASARGAAFLVHAIVREGTPTVANISGTAEGLVVGARRSIALRFDTTSRPGVFAVRRQWPSEGTWLLKVSLYNTTAIVSLDRAGNFAGVRIPTEIASGSQVPRAILAREIDSTLTDASKR